MNQAENSNLLNNLNVMIGSPDITPPQLKSHINEQSQDSSNDSAAPKKTAETKKPTSKDYLQQIKK